MTLWQSRFSLLGCALTVPGWGEAGGGGGWGWAPHFCPPLGNSLIVSAEKSYLEHCEYHRF